MGTTALLIALATLGQADDAAWAKYDARKGGFTVLLPGTPVERDERVEVGNLKQRFHSLTLATEDAVFSVVYHDNPALPQPRREPYLDNQRDGTIRQEHGAHVRDKIIALKGNPGREFVFEVFPKDLPPQTHTMRIYLVGDRLYQLRIIVPKDQADSPAIARFLDSFQLRPDAAAEARDVADLQADWKTFSPADGSFEVSLPAEPEESKQSTQMLGATAETTTYAVQVGQVGYTVALTRYDARSARDPKRLLDLNRDVIAAAREARPLREKKLTARGLSGRQFDAEFALEGKQKAGLLRARLFLVGTRLFALTAAGRKEDVDGSEEVDSFFQSFTVKPVKK